MPPVHTAEGDTQRKVSSSITLRRDPKVGLQTVSILELDWFLYHRGPLNQLLLRIKICNLTVHFTKFTVYYILTGFNLN